MRIIALLLLQCACGRGLPAQHTQQPDAGGGVGGNSTNNSALPASGVPSHVYNVRRDIRVGIYPGEQGQYSTIAKREALYGAKNLFQQRLTFQNVHELNYTAIANIFDEGVTPILNMQFRLKDRDDPDPVLKHILKGEFDEPLRKFALECAAGGKPFTIRTLHEFNGDWYPWGLLYNKGGVRNTRRQLEASFKRVIRIFRKLRAPINFQLDINANNGYDDPRPFSHFWPGTWGLSSVSITSYNRAYSTPSHNYTHSFKRGFKHSYEQVAALTNLPIWVAETGTTSKKTDKPQWIRDAFKSIALDFPQVMQVTWFLIDKEQEGSVTDWALNTKQDIEAFKEGYEEMLRLTR